MSKGVTDPFGANPEDQHQKKIFVATFSMLSRLASADGKVSKDEVQIIDRFMKNVLGLDAERRSFAKNTPNSIESCSATSRRCWSGWLTCCCEYPAPTILLVIRSKK